MLQFIIDTCFQLEITQILVIQNVFQPVETYLEIISSISTARFLHYYFVPLLLTLNVEYFVNVVIAGTVSHISMNLLKWIIAEDRPYWWVNESESYSELTRPDLRQTHLTCETSAGNPSGHVMFAATVLYVSTSNILRSMAWYRKAGSMVRYCIWNIFLGVLAMITVSRLYFACHFLHQCLLGAGFGILIGHILNQSEINRKLNRLGFMSALSAYSMLLSLTFAVYGSHYIFETDPQWSIRKAFNWCKDPYNVKPETTPVYSLVREFGLLFGVVLCSPNAKRFNADLEFKWTFPTIVGLTLAYRALFDYIPRWNGVLIFYGCSFLANVLFSFLLLQIVPRLGQRNKKD